MKRLLATLVSLLCCQTVLAVQCDRVIFPRQQQVDLSDLGEFVGNNDACVVEDHNVICTDEKTKKVICLKCLSGSKWHLVKDDVYRCKLEKE